MHTLTLKSPAKINLGLRILAKRPDGYHDIESVFKAVDFGDELALKLRQDDRVVISADEPGLPTDESNLCFRAIQALGGETGTSIGVNISILKRIPIGGGLGGGSSNAAAVLVGMNKMLGLGYSADRLASIGAKIGSDVPFFVGLQLGMGDSAFVSGRGEILDFRPLPVSGRVALVLTGFEVSTPWAYANYKNAKMSLTKSQKKAKFLAFKNQEVLRDLYLENDFEDLVFEVHPELAKTVEQLESAGADFALMSGSGSTVFGLFTGADVSESLLSKACAPYKVVLTRFVS